MFILEAENPQLYQYVKDQNLSRQYELLENCIEIGLLKGPLAFDKYMLWALNHAATANLSQFSGRFREEPVYIGDHRPPHFRDVGGHVDRYVATILENWFEWSPTELAAYALWRLNWIHPFVDGNGRTARAVAYHLVCVRFGVSLRGAKILPERMRENPVDYQLALRAADRAWEVGLLDFSEMEEYLAAHLQAQLQNDGFPGPA